jgi:hypothetical protein
MTAGLKLLQQRRVGRQEKNRRQEIAKLVFRGSDDESSPTTAWKARENSSARRDWLIFCGPDEFI